MDFTGFGGQTARSCLSQLTALAFALLTQQRPPFSHSLSAGENDVASRPHQLSPRYQRILAHIPRRDHLKFQLVCSSVRSSVGRDLTRGIVIVHELDGVTVAFHRGRRYRVLMSRLSVSSPHTTVAARIVDIRGNARPSDRIQQFLHRSKTRGKSMQNTSTSPRGGSLSVRAGGCGWRISGL